MRIDMHRYAKMFLESIDYRVIYQLSMARKQKSESASKRESQEVKKHGGKGKRGK